MTVFASVDQLLSKPARTKTMVLTIGEAEVSIGLRAIGSKAYDDMMAAHPPTKAQRAESAPFNVDSFAPALLSASMTDPEMDLEQATALWTSPDWSRGELSDLFYACVELNSKGLDIPSSAPA